MGHTAIAMIAISPIAFEAPSLTIESEDGEYIVQCSATQMIIAIAITSLLLSYGESADGEHSEAEQCNCQW